MDLAFFRREAGTLVPTDVARSAWSDDQMHGVAVSGALAGAAERAVAEAGRDDLCRAGSPSTCSARHG